MQKLKQKIKNFKLRITVIQGSILNYLNIKPYQKVNTFIVGTQKGGTSALFNYLEKSPEVTGGYKKEIGFFSKEQIFRLGTYWYEKQFSKSKKAAKIFLDASPEYLYHPSVPEKIYDYNPEAKIIILLRNPISRAFSHYNMFKNIHSLPEDKKEILIRKFNKSDGKSMIPLINNEYFPDFMDLIKQEVENVNSLEPSFIRRGYYYEQIKRYIDLFPNEQILILESSTLRENKKATLTNICSFLNISLKFLDHQEYENKHVGKYSEKMRPEEEKYLRDHYKEHNEKLFQLLNKRFDW
ncbi:sulfotransferase family protein [Salegentibacter sediminis]|uniref:sulfotransferase family protein n=1 Tax=Salegentibacter sediminis TaxID=1930251 RepID=UPI0009C0B5D2|nr:sulfotransferase [Salegentibacter sediminis]